MFNFLRAFSGFYLVPEHHNSIKTCLPPPYKECITILLICKNGMNTLYKYVYKPLLAFKSLMKKNVVHQEQFGCSFCAMRKGRGSEKEVSAGNWNWIKKRLFIDRDDDYPKGGLTTYQFGGKNKKLYLAVMLRSFFFNIFIYKNLQLTTEYNTARGPPWLHVFQKIFMNTRRISHVAEKWWT